MPHLPALTRHLLLEGPALRRVRALPIDPDGLVALFKIGSPRCVSFEGLPQDAAAVCLAAERQLYLVVESALFSPIDLAEEHIPEIDLLARSGFLGIPSEPGALAAPFWAVPMGTLPAEGEAVRAP